MVQHLKSATASALALGALCLGACATPGGQASPASAPPRQASDSYYVKAHDAVAGRIAERGGKHATNVILFIGDGMGIATITAARIYAGQSKGVDGESYQLAMDKLPYSAFSKTYTHDSQVADSAPTAVAMTSGIKSYNGTLGITQAADIGNCASAVGNGVDTLWEIAHAKGLATGVISTARITHATPAATFAETTMRDAESDADMKPADRAAGCTDIASQLLDHPKGGNFDVILGGGRQKFLPATMADPEYAGQKGDRTDGRNLMDEWKAQRLNRTAVTDKAGFDAFNWTGDGQILGLFEPSHMQYELDRDSSKEPSIAEMTTAAIKRLGRNPKGYVLMVEGGRVDHALHAGNAARALGDAKALDDAVAAARAATNPDDTLIIVTADHSHTLTIQGYPDRGNPILGLVQEGGKLIKGRDGKPYTTLSLANGPGSICREQADKTYVCDRPDLTNVDTTTKDFLQQSLTPMGSETHGGEDVAIFAGGPGANLFSGVVEQNEIFHVMARSLGLVK
jgi:alkaline phosphatase